MADVPPSQQSPQHRPRKRRRRTIACAQCRSRKLRCDREYPACGRCQKSKEPTKCTYEDGFLWQQPSTVGVASSTRLSNQQPTPTARMHHQADRPAAHPTPDSGISRSSARPQPAISTDFRPVQEKRDRFLETVLGAPKAAVNQDFTNNSELLQRPIYRPTNRWTACTYSIDDDVSASPSQQLDLSPRIMMRGKETKTRYNGSGIFANIITQFPDLRSFAEEIRLSSPHLSALRSDLVRVVRGLWKRVPLNEPFPVPDTMSLIALLPPRPVADILVELFIVHIESTHRILHVPSFLKQVDEFWTQRETFDLTPPVFVVQLLLVLACAWNLANIDDLERQSDDPLKCYTAIEWVLHAEKWIENAHIKRPDINTLRLHVLLIIAQNIHGMKRSKAWLSTSTLVKQAMLAGYHRDPSRYTKVSPFNKEMRRRIWTTIVELDLQVSQERGMPPSVQESDYDTAPALNIMDHQIYEGIDELPEGCPLERITDCSFQAFLTQSLPLRLKACALMHSPRINCRYEEISRLDWELNRHLSKIPIWSIEDSQLEYKMTLIKAMLENKIGLTLLSIHTPFAIAASQEPLFAPSARIRLEVATMILSTQRRLSKYARPLSIFSLGDWTTQAYCSICQLLHEKTASQILIIEDGTVVPSPPSLPLIHTLPGLPESLISLVEVTLTCLETNLLLVVKGAKEYFFMSTILALVKARLWPSQSNFYKQEVVQRVISFAQALFARHAECAHLGERGVGNFETNQAQSLNASYGSGQPFGLDLDALGAEFGVPGPRELNLDPFLEAFDWGDLAGVAFE